jgi:hypothetical protein
MRKQYQKELSQLNKQLTTEERIYQRKLASYQTELTRLAKRQRQVERQIQKDFAAEAKAINREMAKLNRVRPTAKHAVERRIAKLKQRLES